MQKNTKLYSESQTDHESKISHSCKPGKPGVPELGFLSLSQMKKFLSVLSSNKGLAFVSTSCEKHWPSGEGPKENGENKKHSRKQDLCCDKRLNKMG